MGRFARVAASAVLVALSVCAQASAAFPVSLGDGIARLDPLRMFNPSSESLFANVNGVPRYLSPIDIGLFNISAPVDVALRGDTPHFVAPAGAGVANVKLAIPQMHAAYNPPEVSAPAPRLVDPQVNVPPAQTQTNLNAVAVRTAPPLDVPQSTSDVRFGSYAPYTPSLRERATNVFVPARVGKVHFETAFHAMQVCGTADEAAACASASDNTAAQAFTAGTSFDVRTGNSALKVGLSSSIEHVNNGTNNATTGMFPYVPLDPDAQGGLQYFGLTDVVSQSVGAQVAVPVSSRLTVGLQYNRSHLQGDYGTTLLPGFDATKDTYLGNLTYQLPNSSAITFSARQYRFQDALAPNSLTQTRADLNFTVKF
jgi:hypothetical protein